MKAPRLPFLLPALVLTAWVLLAIPFAAASETVIIDDFSAGHLDGWRVRRFSGETNYRLVLLEGRRVLRAQTDQAASALYRNVDIDLLKTPYLNWSWRIENIHAIDDQRIKAGDDFPARIYVVVKTGVLPWQTRALNYVWSNYPSGQAFWANPFTDKTVMIPLRQGNVGLGQWHTERVNIREDYFRVFQQWIDKIDGIAIMSDADNAGGSATAYYGAISFSP